MTVVTISVTDGTWPTRYVKFELAEDLKAKMLSDFPAFIESVVEPAFKQLFADDVVRERRKK